MNSVVIKWRHVLRCDWIMVLVMSAASPLSRLLSCLYVVKVRKLLSFVSPLSKVLEFVFAVTFVRPGPGCLSCETAAFRSNFIALQKCKNPICYVCLQNTKNVATRQFVT